VKLEMAPLTPTLRSLEGVRHSLLRAQKAIRCDDFDAHASIRSGIEKIEQMMLHEVRKDDPNSELNTALRASIYLAEMGERVERLESSVSGLLGRETL
jgi:hypothetical protein